MHACIIYAHMYICINECVHIIYIYIAIANSVCYWFATTVILAVFVMVTPGA